MLKSENRQLVEKVQALEKDLKAGKERERSMQAKIEELHANASKAETAAEDPFFKNVADSAKQSVANVVGIEDPNERKKAMMNILKLQCHPDKNPAALSCGGCSQRSSNVSR